MCRILHSALNDTTMQHADFRVIQQGMYWGRIRFYITLGLILQYVPTFPAEFLRIVTQILSGTSREGNQPLETKGQQVNRT